jgi:hypothetical protein
MKNLIEKITGTIALAGGSIAILDLTERKIAFNKALKIAKLENENQSSKITELVAQNSLNSANATKKNLDLKDKLSEVTDSGNSLFNEMTKDNGPCISESCKRI